MSMFRIILPLLTAIVAASALLFQSGPATATGPDWAVPGMARLTATIPAPLYGSDTHINCLVRTERRIFDQFPVRATCYSAVKPLPPPSSPPAYFEPVHHRTFTATVDSVGNFVFGFGCFEFIPGMMAVSVVFEIPFDHGIVSGDYVTMYVDTTPPLCSGSTAQFDGPVTFEPLPIDHDEDGDGCTDWYELGENAELGGLNDPFNPDAFANGQNDCDGLAGEADELDAYGLYDLSYKLTEGPVTGYRQCKLLVTQITDDLTPIMGEVYCYTDIPGVDINPEDCPDESGDGLRGAPPPGPECSFGGLAFGDVDEVHTQIAGEIVGGTLQLDGTYKGGTAKLEGCFEDLDGEDPLGHVIVRWEWDVQTGSGTSDTWTHQAIGDCEADPSTPVGTPETETFQALKLAGRQAAQLEEFGDTDVDGIPDSRELLDETKCGRRDPYNPYDYYDVSIPRDGVIDLPNDILGVILHFATGGYPPGDENWDRPPVMTGAGLGSTWNRGSPDGVIDLPNDILGVILQFNPAGCPALG